MSLNLKYFLPKLLFDSEKDAIEALGGMIKSGSLRADEIAKINEKNGSPIIPSAHPVNIYENRQISSTEVYVDNVEATRQNRILVRKIEDIIFRN